MDPKPRAKHFFKPILDFEPIMSTANMIHCSHINGMSNDVAGHGGRKSTKGGVFAAPMSVTELPDAKKSLLLIEFFSPDRVCELDNRAMALANRDYYNNILTNSQWHDEANDGMCRQWARDISALVQEEMEACKIGGRLTPKTEGVGTYVKVS
ncbi:MAG: hypothetical protein Q9171_002391 [Xanthocarpia ochracea]